MQPPSHLSLEPYQEQAKRLPATGRHILGQYDHHSIIVYQAYRPSIAQFAVKHGYFGGEFSLGRMSWIKTSFLWMMRRSGWGTKKGQEAVLAIRLKRSAFDTILAQAVHSTFQQDGNLSEEGWKRALLESPVRLQWDPDYTPSGTPLERRAIQLGLRGDILAKYAREWIIRVQDISRFVRAQRAHALAGGEEDVMIPKQRVYPVHDSSVAARLGLEQAQP